MCLGRVNSKNLAERHLLVVVGTGLRLEKVVFKNLNVSKRGVLTFTQCEKFLAQITAHTIWVGRGMKLNVEVGFKVEKFEFGGERQSLKLNQSEGVGRPTLDLDYLDKSIKWG